MRLRSRAQVAHAAVAVFQGLTFSPRILRMASRACRLHLVGACGCLHMNLCCWARIRGCCYGRCRCQTLPMHSMFDQEE